jgi:hypothetical protein
MSSISRIECVPDLSEQAYQRLLRAISDGELAYQPSITFRSLKPLPVTWDEARSLRPLASRRAYD